MRKRYFAWHNDGVSSHSDISDSNNTKNSTSNADVAELGALPNGRPPQTQVDDGRDWPRLGTVSFRRGTLTDNQAALWQEHWSTLGKTLSDEPIDTEAWFGRKAPTILEIGCGTGTSTAAMAKLEPDFNIIAVELYKPGLAQLLGACVREGLDNVRFVRADGVEVLHRMIPSGSLAGVRIFFPDPWPKARHHKRRIVQSGPLHLIADRLAPGGVLHVATDHADYAEWISELTDVEPNLEFHPWPWDDCPILTDRQLTTKFETRGLRLEHNIQEFLWSRR